MTQLPPERKRHSNFHVQFRLDTLREIAENERDTHLPRIHP